MLDRFGPRANENEREVLTVTWSIHTRSVLSRVMASPPHTYWGFRSVIMIFWIMIFVAPLTILNPLPLMTPLLPSPTSDLLLFTIMIRVNVILKSGGRDPSMQGLCA